MKLLCALHDFGLLSASAPESDPTGTLIVAAIAFGIVVATVVVFLLLDAEGAAR